MKLLYFNPFYTTKIKFLHLNPTKIFAEHNMKTSTRNLDIKQVNIQTENKFLKQLETVQLSENSNKISKTINLVDTL